MKLLFNGKERLTIPELLRPLENWEINEHCLRSIKYHHKKVSNKNKGWLNSS
jgi:hypothetical protein